MRLPFFYAFLATIVFGAWCEATYGQQQGTRYCYTTTTGHVQHEYCSFTPLTVAAPAVTVQAPAVTVQPAPVVIPKPQAAPEKKVRE